MDCCNPVDEEVFVNICLQGMLEECCIFLENLSFQSFSRLMEAVKRTNETVTRTTRPNSISRPSSMIRPPLRKRSIVAAIERG